MYCSEQCKEEASQVYHAKECPLRPKAKIEGVEDALLSLLRLTKSHGVDAFCAAMKNKTSSLTSCSLDTLFLVPAAELDTDNVLAPALLLLWAKELGFKEQDVCRVVSAMARALPLLTNSAFSVQQVVRTGGFLGEDTFGVVGNAFCPMRTLLEASCSPNTVDFNVGRRTVFQATRLIRAGTLVSQRLRPVLDFLKVGRDLRQSFLRETPILRPGEQCGCEACVRHWPTLDKLENRPEELEAVVLAQSALTSRLLPLALAKAEDLERRDLQHTKQFHQLQQRLRAHLALQGNVAALEPNHPLQRFLNIFTD